MEIRYGMVGGGPDGNIGSAHRDALNLIGAQKPTAGCFSRSISKNMEMAHSLGMDLTRCYADYREMAQKESRREDKIDFVVVVTPNASHYEICKEFLQAGIHVVCDKPFTTTVDEAEELVELAKEKNLLIMVTYTYTGHHMFRRAARMIRSGAIGEIRKVVAEYPQSWMAFEGACGGKQGAWRCDPKQTGRVNCLGDIGSHIENAVHEMTGLRISRVAAQMTSVVPGRVLDDDDVVLVEYESGQTGVYWSAQYAFGHDNDLLIRVYGSEGSVIWTLRDPLKIQYAKTDGSCEILRADAKDVPFYGAISKDGEDGWRVAMSNLYCNFCECIQHKRQEDGTYSEESYHFPTGLAGLGGLQYIEACVKSSQNGGTWTTL